MPSRAKKLECDVAKLPSIPKKLVEHFLTDPMSGEAINGAGLAFKEALVEASLNAELSHHLGYRPGGERPEGATNRRHGFTGKTVLSGDGKLCIATPRDCNGSFEPVLLPSTPAGSPRWTTASSLCMRGSLLCTTGTMARQPGWPVVLPHPKMLPSRRAGVTVPP